MSKVQIDWNPDWGFDLRRSDGVVSDLDSRAQGVADRANASGKGTYAVGSQQGRRNPQGRWRTSVVTADAEAMIDNAKNNTLIRALD